jgi:hypothetical protein
MTMPRFFDGSAFRAPLLRTLALAPLFVLAACGDGQPTLFSAPEVVRLEGSRQLQGIVEGEAAPLPRFRVLDADGNPAPGVRVEFRTEEGAGTITPSVAFSGEDGTVQAERWVLGSQVGANAAFVDFDRGLGTIRLDADALPFYSVEAVHLNQGNQYMDGRTGGVADRPGLLRVLVRARIQNTVAPDVRVRLFQDGTLLREEVIPAPLANIPTQFNLNQLTHTWNLPLAAEEVVAGLSVEVLLDPDGTLDMGPRDHFRYPRDPGVASAPLDVQPLAPLQVVLVPITSTNEGGATGNIHSGNVEEFMADTRRWIPLHELEYVIDQPFVTAVDIRTTSGWTILLGDLAGKRAADGAFLEYYHGIMPGVQGVPIAGLAYVPPNPGTLAARTALSYDRLPRASLVVAHELGHNLGRLHAPCGNPSGVDTNYPHANALLGSPGWDVLTNQLIHPDSRNDYMSYCEPGFTSDYTFQGILNWRRNDPVPGGGALELGRTPIRMSPEARAPVPGLLLFGIITSSGVTLNPAFQLEAPPALPQGGGPHELRGVADDGRELFRFSFQGSHPAHSPDPEERHFSFFVPLSRAEMEAVERIELRSPRGNALRTSGLTSRDAQPPLRDPEVVMDRVDGDRMRLRWEENRFPMAMLRDPETGRVVGFARGGELVALDVERRMDRMEVLLSDGVRSAPARKR